MPTTAHPSRATLAEAETQTGLIDLLLARLERSYVTAERAEIQSVVRDLFRRMDPAELRALAYDLDVIREPGREEQDGAPRPEEIDDGA